MMSRNLTCPQNNQSNKNYQSSRVIAMKAYRYDRIVRETLMAVLLIFPYWVVSM